MQGGRDDLGAKEREDDALIFRINCLEMHSTSKRYRKIVIPCIDALSLVPIQKIQCESASISQASINFSTIPLIIHPFVIHFPHVQDDSFCVIQPAIFLYKVRRPPAYLGLNIAFLRKGLMGQCSRRQSKKDAELCCCRISGP